MTQKLFSEELIENITSQIADSFISFYNQDIGVDWYENENLKYKKYTFISNRYKLNECSKFLGYDIFICGKINRLEDDRYNLSFDLYKQISNQQTHISEYCRGIISKDLFVSKAIHIEVIKDLDTNIMGAISRNIRKN